MSSTVLEPQTRDRLKLAEDQCDQDRFAEARRLYEEAAQDLMSPKHLPPKALALYGLTIAQTERGRTAEAVAFCKEALRRDVIDPTPWYALARIYDLGGSRRKAIDALHRGLRVDPTDRRLLRMRKDFGVRARPVLPFLPRSHPVNVFLGRIRHAIKR